MNDLVPSYLDEQPMSNAPVVSRSVSASADAEVSRAIAEVQGAIVLAKKFPRNPDQCIAEIKAECSRVALAEVATYEYAKGGTKITGPSIRLAEALCLAWGNVHSGWRELDRRMINGDLYAEIEAWAWDLEKNKREPVLFKVKLVRNTKKGSYPLKDEREIYEHCANQAKRRERACILACIPGYVIDLAVDQCEETLKKTVNSDTTKKMIAAFLDRFGVTKEQIQKFIQCDIEAVTPAQVVRLRNIFNSLKDGMSKADEWFEVEKPQEEEKPVAKGVQGLKDALAKTTAVDATPGAVIAVDGNGNAADVQIPFSEKAPNTPTGDLFALIEMLGTCKPEERLAVFMDNNGQTLVETVPHTSTLDEKLKGWGIHLPPTSKGE